MPPKDPQRTLSRDSTHGFSTGASVHRRRQMSTLVEKEGQFGPALTVSLVPHVNPSAAVFAIVPCHTSSSWTASRRKTKFIPHSGPGSCRDSAAPHSQYHGLMRTNGRSYY